LPIYSAGRVTLPDVDFIDDTEKYLSPYLDDRGQDYTGQFVVLVMISSNAKLRWKLAI
jgi:hypothetical protein